MVICLNVSQRFNAGHDDFHQFSAPSTVVLICDRRMFAIVVATSLVIGGNIYIYISLSLSLSFIA